MRPRHFAEEICGACAGCCAHVVASMRPRHFAEEIQLLRRITSELDIASMRPRHFAEEIIFATSADCNDRWLQ